MGRDLISRPYGRFHYLPGILAAKGHEVMVLLLSYSGEADQTVVRNGVVIKSVSLIPSGPIKYLFTANQLVKDYRPDWIVGCSDTYFGISAQYLAARHGSRSLIDAYDNYESYLPWCYPLHQLWRRALGRATVVSAAGPQLADLLRKNRPGSDVSILPMAADPEFLPLDQAQSRRELGLHLDKKLIGYCGAIYRNRGIEFLFKLAEHLGTMIPDAEMVVSGRMERGLAIPANIRWLGYLPDNKMPTLLNSMDVLLVLNRESAFGKYSYPVKLYEAMQCRIPVVASNTEPARWVLGGDRRFLAKVGALEDFSAKVIAALDLGKTAYPPQSSWEDVAGELEKILSQ